MKTLPSTLQRLTILSDEKLVASVLGGNGPVFELLMRRHNQRLFRVARAIVQNNGEAEEIVQETYVRAFASLAQFEGRSTVVTWLSRIALHESLRSRRRQRRARAMDPTDIDRMRAADAGNPAPDPIDRTETRRMLTTALDSLPTGLRTVVMLRLVEELSTRETAECLRLTEANVKASLHRARKLLSKTIQRKMMSEFRHQFSFGEANCDRIVAVVFRRLDKAVDAVHPSPRPQRQGMARLA